MDARTDTFFSFYRKVALFQRLITTVFGLACLIITPLMVDLLALAPSTTTSLLLRIFGASLIYVAVVTFVTRDTRSLLTVRGISIANIVEDGMLCILSILGILTGTLGGISWILVLAFAGEVLLNTYVLQRAHRAISAPHNE